MAKANPNDLYWRAFRLGIPREIVVPFIESVLRWEKDSGPEWTVARLKAVKNDFVRIAAGQPAVAVWITRNGDKYSGVLGGLQKWAWKSSKNFRRSIQLLACYTYFKSDSLTEKQWNKETKAINSPNASEVPWPNIIRLLGWKAPELDTQPLPIFLYPANKRTPQNWGYGWKPQYWSIWPFLLTTKGRVYLENPHVFNSIMNFCVSLGINQDQPPEGLPVEDEFTAGNILLNQERGFKLRLAAAPSLVFQVATYPLKVALYDIIRKDESSSVFDQDMGRERVSEWLRSGERVYSFDLSSATHRFPLSLQISLLKDLQIDNDMISLVEMISREDWLLPTGEKISWKAGQPLGLMPSYGMFHLTHLAMILSRGISADEVVILGDDVALKGSNAASIYEQLCDDLDLTISQDKTLSSSVLAEFAGHLITRAGHFPVWKWGGINDRNFVDQAKALPEAITTFPKKYQKVLGIISQWPEWYGGLGQNPHGKPLRQRLPPLQMILDMEQPEFSVPERPMSTISYRNPEMDWVNGVVLQDVYDQYTLDMVRKDWGPVKGDLPLPIKGPGLRMEIPDPSLSDQYRHWTNVLSRLGLV